MLAAWRERGGVVAASYGGARGHPLVLGREDWRDIPDEGLRDRAVRLVPCDDLGAPGDVDTPARSALARQPRPDAGDSGLDEALAGRCRART